MANPEMPACMNETRTEMTWEADLVFAATAPYFQGHFPDCPVLPGVVQLGVARAYAAAWLGVDIELTSVKKMKFTRVVVPGMRVHLALARHGLNEVVYEFRKEADVCASGVLCF